jgi:hypothetical protein
MKILRIELITAFKFERNGYAHQLVDIPKPQGLAVVSRLMSLLDVVADISRDSIDTSPS